MHIFQQLAKKGKLAGVDMLDPVEAREWFRNMAIGVSKRAPGGQPRKIIAGAGAFEKVTPAGEPENLSDNSIGRMYLFHYDAKLKKKLPYWDAFPLVFFIDFKHGKEDQGVLGINLHYLPPYQRAKLMDALYGVANNEKFDKTTKLKVSYSILKSVAQFSLFRPCLHMYLLSPNYVKSSFVSINPAYWDMALFLPLARFQGLNENAVWMQSTLMDKGTIKRPMNKKQWNQFQRRR